MSGALEKSLAILECLAAHPEGVALVHLSENVHQLRSGCHRTLHELVRHGYVRQVPPHGDYTLTTKLASMGLSYLSKSGVVDITQPMLNRLARTTEELVRLAVVDGDRLTLVAKAQGAKSGLLYDPDMGIELQLSSSAAGHAWLMTLTEEEALEAIERQGLATPSDYGPNTPTSVKALLRMLQEHRRRGFSIVREAYAPGMSSMAAPIQRRGERATGVVIVAGPSFRLTEERMLAIGPELMAIVGELALAGQASPLLKSAKVGTWGNRVAG